TRQAYSITMNENVYALFAARFPADRRAPCIEMPDGRCFSYADLETQTARHARFLAGRGIAPGDRVAVQVEKSPQALFFYLACLRAGAIYVPLTPAYRRAEIECFLDDAELRLAVCAPSLFEAMQAAAARRGIRHVLTVDASGRGTLADAAAAAPAEHAVHP